MNTLWISSLVLSFFIALFYCCELFGFISCFVGLVWFLFFFSSCLMCSYEIETILGIFFITSVQAWNRNLSRSGSLKQGM